MNIPFETITSILSLLGGGGCGAFFTWRYIRRQEAAKAKQEEANAVTAETTAVKEVQDVYQQLISDVKSDRNEQKQYIQELKDDRRHLREERDELRTRIDQTDEEVRKLQRDVSRNTQMVESLRPFICAVRDCPNRVAAILSADGEIKPKRTIKKKEQ